MKIVQSFWSCGKSMLTAKFGWLSPQYHVMAWALSCLRLKEYYEDIHFYTDQEGYNLLVDYLQLPYNEVHVNYDTIDKRYKNSWALPKILTYRSQDSPFIHVDGDVFIWERLPQEIESAGLVSQNFEISTEYYLNLMNSLKVNLSYLTDDLKKELDKPVIGSYNAGILGGSDVDFFKRYSKSALELIERNHHEHRSVSDISFNILFEQIMFFTLTEKESKEVTTLFKHPINDIGYSSSQFADFSAINYELKYLHIIGKKKSDPNICEMLARTLFSEYPQHFLKIVALFKNEHVYFEKKISSYIQDSRQINQFQRKSFELSSNTEQHKPKRRRLLPTLQKNAIVEKHEKLLATLKNQWSSLDNDLLFELAKNSTKYHGYFFKKKEQQLIISLKLNPYLSVIEDSFDWSEETKKSININLIGPPGECFGLAYVPQLFFKGYQEIIIDELDYNILAILETPHCLAEISPYIISCIPNSVARQKDDSIYNLLLLKLQKLFFYQCIAINKD